ncbi:cytochrome c biogenesis protein DipZ, partial [Candidatus Dojkabacteria bacterium]|nr:cytochrome c biogenesis protein DipZ [Candidatus Dojkabacteria bacterium]
MEYLPVSFIAGILTILAPCVIPVLPVVIGGSLENTKNTLKPIVITVSLAVSIVVFTLLLKASTALLSIDPRIWNYISGVIILFFGIITLFPSLWERIALALRLNTRSGQLLQKSST